MTDPAQDLRTRQDRIEGRDAVLRTTAGGARISESRDRHAGAWVVAVLTESAGRNAPHTRLVDERTQPITGRAAEA